MLQFYLTRKPS